MTKESTPSIIEDSSSETIRVADFIARTVEKQGSDSFFMLSGGMMMHLMDAFGRTGMRYYCNHHEQASAMAADAYARQSGKLGVCLATSGPGATNLLTGLVGAYQDSVPVLFLTGQCKRKETIRYRGIKGLRQCGFLETDIVPIVESVTKYAAFVDEPKDIRYHLEKAIHLATTGRPGPVLLDMPLDVQGATVNLADLRGYEPEAKETATVSVEDLHRLVETVRKASRPVILAGHGVRAAGFVELFRSIIERWKVPVVTSMMAKDLLPDNHPQLAGQIGMRGHRGSNFVVQSADLILSMGCSLQVQTAGYEGELFAPEAYKIQIEREAGLLSREDIRADWKLHWDLSDYLPLLDKQIASSWTGADGAWPKTCQEWKDRFTSPNEPHLIGEETSPINLYEFIHLLNDATTGNETILTDAGQPFYILPQALRLKEGQRYLTPGSLAEMGWALPASLGVAAAAPANPVIAIIGDGSFQTNIQELQTLIHHRFNIKIFVINNDGYASIRNTQRSFFAGFVVGSTPESGVTLPSLPAIAKAYGIPYLHCANRSEAAVRIREALAAPGPMICEVMSQVDQKVMPIVPSHLLPDGTMRSKALHEMVPDVGVYLGQLRDILPV